MSEIIPLKIKNREASEMRQDKRFFFLMVISLMGSASLLATGIYLPALPEMAVYFSCSEAEIQASVSLFLMGLAASQLVYGILADYFGRKLVTLIGLTLFTIASLWCAHSSTLTEFLMARIFQAIGGGVGSVINRTIIADRFNKTESVKIFSTIFPIIGLSATIGPLIGGYLTSFFGWRSPFYFMMGFGLLTSLLVIFFLAETRKELREENKARQSPRERLLGYASVFRNFSFLGYALVLCASFASFQCYSVESPFVFNNQGYAPEEMGPFYISLSLGYISGNLCARKLVNIMSVEKLLSMGFLFFAIGVISMIIGSLYYGDSPYAIVLPITLITFGNGFLFPSSSAGAMSSVPIAFSGMASGLMGALQFMAAAICIHWVGDLCQGEALWMSLFIGIIFLVGFLGHRLLMLRPKAQPVISG